MKEPNEVVIFDLETIPNKALIPLLPEVVANKNLKDPVKVAADIERKSKTQVADMAKDPLFNMICCAGWCDLEGNSGGILLEKENRDSEIALLVEFWELLAKYDTFVTYNGRGFDARTMLLHGMDYGIRPAVNIDNGRYNRGNHIDMRLVLNGNDPRGKGTMDFFARRFGQGGKTENIDGSMVGDYWEMGLKQDILKYCIQDCEETKNLLIKAVVGGLLEDFVI